MLKRIATALLFLQLAVLPAFGQTWTWTGAGATNSWLDPQNWSPQSVPPDGADVNLLLGLPKLDAPVVIRRLRMSAGYLDGSGNVTVTERMDWTSGVLQGSGTLTIAPGASLYGSATFNGIPLTLSRKLVIAGFAATRAQHIVMSNGSLEITSSGVLEITGDAGTAAALSRETGYTAQCTNNGTLRKVSAAKATINVPLDCGSDSRVEFVEGTLHLRQPGTFACKLNVPAAGSLILENTRTYAPGFEISGPGPIEIRSGTHDFPPQGIKDLGPFTISGGAGLLFSDPWETDAPFTVLESSTFGTNSTATFRTLTCKGGLRGTGTIRVKEQLTLDTASIRNPLTVVLEPGAAGSIRTAWIGGTLRVEGDIDFLPSNINLYNDVPGRFEVAAGASVDLITVPEELGTVWVQYGTIDNRGTVRKVGDAKGAFLYSAFENLGVLEAASGTLHVNGPFTNNGMLRTQAGTTVSIASATESVWGPESNVEGPGNFVVETIKITSSGKFDLTGPLTIDRGRFTLLNPPPLLPGPISVVLSGELGLGGDTTVSDLVVNNAKLNIGGHVSFTKAVFTAASWSGSGTGRFPPGSLVTINQITGANAIVNESADTKLSQLSAGNIYNAPGGVFTVVNPGSAFVAFSTPLLVNDGLITIPTSTSINGVLLNNGEIRLTAGMLTTSRAPANFVAGTLNGGRWITSGSGRFQFSDTTDPVLTTIGPDTIVRLSGLNSDIGGSTGLRPLSRNEGVLDLASRVKDIAPAGGTLVNAGELRLRAGALLSVLGNLTFDPAGSIQLDIGGTSWDTSGAMKVTGTLALGGRLLAGPVPAFVPTPASTFLIATSGGRQDQFDELLGVNGYGPRPLFASTNVYLRLGTCPPDFNGDSVVDDQDFAIFAAAYDLADCAEPEMPADCPADFDFSGAVDDADFSLFASRYDRVLCY